MASKSRKSSRLSLDHAPVLVDDPDDDFRVLQGHHHFWKRRRYRGESGLPGGGNRVSLATRPSSCRMSWMTTRALSVALISASKLQSRRLPSASSSTITDHKVQMIELSSSRFNFLYLSAPKAGTRSNDALTAYLAEDRLL